MPSIYKKLSDNRCHALIRLPYKYRQLFEYDSYILIDIWRKQIEIEKRISLLLERQFKISISKFKAESLNYLYSSLDLSISSEYEN